jgi:hypothetical protein
MEPIVGVPLNPWVKRKEIGFFAALIQTIRLVLTRPAEFFANLKSDGPISEPYLFYCIVSIVSGTLSLSVARLVDKSFARINYGLALALFYVLVVGLIFLSVYIIHLSVRIFKGQGTYRATFNVMAYASATSIFSIIPFIGSFISGVWAIAVVVIGLKCMHNFTTARAFMAYLIIPLIAVTLLVAAIAIPNLLRAKVSVNESSAKSNILMISSGIEIYKANNSGVYPENEYDLRFKDKPYINRAFHNKTISGYRYSLELSTDGYKISAAPQKCRETGEKKFTKTHSQELQEEQCK